LGPDNSELYLPVSVDRFTRYRAPSAQLWAHSVLRPYDDDGARVADIRIYDDAGQIVATLDGLALRRAAGAEPTDCLFEVTWQSKERGKTVIRAPGEIAASVRPQANELLLAHGLDRYETLQPLVDRMAAEYVVAALRSMGWSPNSGDHFTPSQLVEQLKVVPRQRALFHWMLGWLAQDGMLRADGDVWTVESLPAPAMPQADQLRAAYPQFATELELTARCGSQLAGVLQGTTDPLDLLFPGGSLDIAERLYTESPGALAFNTLIRNVVKRAVQHLSPGRPLRILEIGGGTGGTTTHVAPILPVDHVEYTFTDVSPHFTAKARERFAHYPFLRYDVLDLEQDPVAQGFMAGQYDLILASNVVHATMDIRRSLERVSTLLAPGGLLVMLEVTRAERWIDLTFGMTEGWWSFRDYDLRASHALLEATQWEDLLAEFGDVALLEPDMPAWSTVLLLQKPEETPPSLEGDWLILADQYGIGAQLAMRLKAHGGRCTLVPFGQSFNDLHQTWRGVVHLWSVDAPSVHALDDDGLAQAQALVCESTLQLAQLLERQDAAPLWLVTRGAQVVAMPEADAPQAASSAEIAVAQAPLWGMSRTIAHEYPDLRCHCIDLDPTSANSVESLWQEIQVTYAEDQVVLRGMERFVARITPVEPTRRATRMRLTIPTRGTLDNVRVEPAQRRTPGPGQVEVRVDVSGVTFRDVLNVLGMYPGDPGPLGGECAGRVERVGAGVTTLAPGDAVVAVASGSHDGYVLVDSPLAVRVPAQLSPEEAVSIAISFLTAAYTLEHLANIQPGDRVLIHAATGGVGMAAVQFAQRAGAEVFATAGSDAKRDYLRAMGVTHVYNSRTLDFADQILADTQGAGVTVVLNSLADDFVEASFRTLAPGGRFLEIGKRGIWTHEQVEQLGRDIAYHIVDWGEVAARDPVLIGTMLQTLMDAAARSEIRPLPVRVFAIDDAVSAFRYMAQARHVGKVVLRQPALDVRIVPDATYLIAGGLGGLGLRCAHWLVDRGARFLALAGRSEPSEAAMQEVEALRADGVRVDVLRADIARAADVDSLFQHITRELPPLRGVINAAGTLADGTLHQQTWDRFQRVLGPKMDGSWHLHQQTRDRSLDFFLLFSSVASILGAPGQANHAAANAFEDALAQVRRADGLPAISINWGAWSELGSAIREDLEQRRARLGVGTLAPSEAIALLERIIRQNPVQIAAARMDWKKFVAGRPVAAARLAEMVRRQAERQTSHRDERRTALAERPSASGQTESQVDGQAPVATSLLAQLAATPETQRWDALRDHLEAIARTVLGFSAGRRIDPQQPLQQLGLDSLMAVEFRNTLAASIERPLPATLLFSYPAVDDIATHVGRDLLGWSDGSPASAAAAAASASTDGAQVLGAIEDLSDEEVDRLFAQQLKGGTA
jgi:NADPH:quinone reductase-like Zn-dependent oxidoreductase/SAM-dependent methyltransferase/NADP-dependent 3-hydroxy acid dehydrogenase YdfG